MDKNTPIHARFGACFHGECHYICPTCNKSFESYNAKSEGNYNRCPHCGQLLSL